MNNSILLTPEMDERAMDQLAELHKKKYPGVPYMGDASRGKVSASTLLSCCLWTEACTSAFKVYRLPEDTYHRLAKTWFLTKEEQYANWKEGTPEQRKLLLRVAIARRRIKNLLLRYCEAYPVSTD